MLRSNRLPSQLAFGSLAALIALAVPSASLAQDPVAPVKEPNVLLVVDSSGSMEYKSGSDTFPTCNAAYNTSEKSRWIELVEVLSGTIKDYACQKIDRSSATFDADYKIKTQSPPDKNYRNPYHRPHSGDCAYMPNPAWADRTNAYEWDEPIPKLANGTVCASGFSPFGGSGLLNSYGDLVRFALMTFDTLPDPGSGEAAAYSIDLSSGVKGAWSYYVGASATGRPVDCTDPQAMEVGVRNGAAPPWEGRLIPFGNPDADLTTNRARHTRIKQTLMSSRPYGATPIAGALQDARDFLWKDSRLDPLGSGKGFGPHDDLYVKGKCREQAIILLTDGEPNLDMRPTCELTNSTDPAKNGQCPFLKPEEIAGKLLNGDSGSGTEPPVKTYVIGFAKTTSDSGLINCETMAPSEWTTPGGACATAGSDSALTVCCNLHKIADAGGTTRAEFASNQTALNARLDAIVAKIRGGGRSSATQPVSAGIGQNDVSPDPSKKTVGYKLLTSFETKSQTGQVWPGYFERARWACESNVPKLQEKNATYGDDFGTILAAHQNERTFSTFVAETVGTTKPSGASLRPFLPAATSDGAGAVKGSQIQQVGSSFVGLVDEKALLLGNPATAAIFSNNGTPVDTSDDGYCQGLSETACRDRILNWLLGYNNGTGFHRCPTSANCSLLGDILHSTPVVVDRPNPTVPDESYTEFATSMKERPIMAYTSSNDGILHGFQISANKASDAPSTPTDLNERFAFIPPMTLGEVQKSYPGVRQKLLDGIAVVRDVVATVDTTFSDYQFKLERNASATQAKTSKWRTILLQAFGGAYSGYFALDVTDPRNPKFLWQLTTDEAGKALFGTNPGTPLITTLNINQKEVAVAILPGGSGGAPNGGTCSRKYTGVYSEISSAYDPTGLSVHCYDPGSVPARSLTVVRLDSGEIVKTFRQTSTEVHPNLQTRVVVSDLDSPITGAPSAYPYLIGSVSDRVFIGDQDGTLWKVNFSDPNPDNWTMKLFFDTYVKYPGSTIKDARHPISNPPVLSVDVRGQVTVAVSTGDQDLSGSSGDYDYVWSLTETINSGANGFVAVPNWYHELRDGKHVLGPIQLTNETLYYSTIAKSTDPAVAACNGAVSEVWGVHYLKGYTASGAVVAGAGGLGALTPTTTVGSSSLDKTVQSLAATDIGLDPGTIIFGVAVEVLPSCVTSDSSSDPYFGGARTKSDIKSNPTTALTFQTGSATTSQGGLNFKTNFESIGLKAAPPTSKNESWGAILD